MARKVADANKCVQAVARVAVAERDGFGCQVEFVAPEPGEGRRRRPVDQSAGSQRQPDDTDRDPDRYSDRTVRSGQLSCWFRERKEKQGDNVNAERSPRASVNCPETAAVRNPLPAEGAADDREGRESR